MNKIKFIDVDATLHARAKLMEEYKAREHVNWDPDQEIKTQRDKEAVLTKGAEEEDTNEGESSPMAESPKQAKPEMGTNDKVKDAGPDEPVDPIKIQVDIAKDYTCIYFFICLYIFDDCASSNA